ncbi:MAG: polyketide cyclase [Alistipes sp.]|nr:polyketide cyclase [Candidatus Alistipes equi]
MEKYESQQQQVLRPADAIFPVISNFALYTPVLKDKVEQWEATEDRCSFKLKGFNIALQMIEKEPGRHVKIVPDCSLPGDFAFWIQLKQVAPADTRIRLVLHAEMNMMIKMMIGGKLQKGLDQVAQALAEGLNRNL